MVGVTKRATRSLFQREVFSFIHTRDIYGGLVRSEFEIYLMMKRDISSKRHGRPLQSRRQGSGSKKWDEQSSVLYQPLMLMPATNYQPNLQHPRLDIFIHGDCHSTRNQMMIRSMRNPTIHSNKLPMSTTTTVVVILQNM